MRTPSYITVWSKQMIYNEFIRCFQQFVFPNFSTIFNNFLLVQKNFPQSSSWKIITNLCCRFEIQNWWNYLISISIRSQNPDPRLSQNDTNHHGLKSYKFRYCLSTAQALSAVGLLVYLFFFCYVPEYDFKLWWV